jgi:SpoVK/Ycf46/Vps4 family AAA+-type ATPase
VAAAADATLFVLNGADILTEYYGEAERGLAGDASQDSGAELPPSSPLVW